MAYGTVNADVIGTSITGTNLGPGNASLMKNRLINGAMLVSQRYGTTTPVGAQGFSVDRWASFFAGSGRYSFTQSSVVPAGEGFSKSLLYTVTTAVSPAAGDAYQIFQAIEGYNISDLEFGTANAKTVTVSFWVRSSLAGLYAFRLYGAPSRFYVTTYTITAANTWQKIVITVPGDTSGTWDTTNGQGLGVTFDLGSGSNYNTATTNAWQSSASDPRRTSGTVTWINTLGRTLYLTGIQLEVGSNATGFEHRQFEQELALCQRYYEKSYNIETPIGTSLGASVAALESTGMVTAVNTTRSFGKVDFKVNKRANPTVFYWDENGNASAVTVSSGSGGFVANNYGGDAFRGLAASQSRLSFQCDVTPISNPGCCAIQWAADSEL